ncbi:MAG: PA14 domain-containing protein [Myxococcota bacterium]
MNSRNVGNASSSESGIAFDSAPGAPSLTASDGAALTASTGAPLAATDGAPIAATDRAPIAATDRAPIAATDRAPIAATNGAPLIASGGAVFTLDPRRDSRRLLVCAAIALSLHAASALFRVRGRALRAPTAADVDAALLLSVDEIAGDNGPPPGGGSPEPEPTAKQSAPEQKVQPAVKHARVVVRAPVEKISPQANDQPEDTTTSDLGPPPADLLATADGTDPPAPERPRAARSQRLENVRNEAAASPDAAAQEASNSSSEGEGFGINGGPGGTGRGNGNGVINQRFAFGGPKGSFRGDICFIDDNVKRLSDISACSTVRTFFTDVINVEPRRFTEGFPGVSSRTAWFAIKYRGKFKVKSADYYTFRLLSDDGAILHIDGYPILDNDGQHMPRSVQSTITLEAGEHEFSLFYYQGPPEFLALQLFVKPFEGTERLFGPTI